jgi:hypothetical protein
VDEKAQIQALDRTQSLLPMRPGQVERRTHGYTRHGTTSLFAALNVKTGKVIGECHRRHRAKEFRKFLGLPRSRCSGARRPNAIRRRRSADGALSMSIAWRMLG